MRRRALIVGLAVALMLLGTARQALPDPATPACSTVGSLDGDAYGDVVVGVPGETVSGAASAGGFAVLYGSSSGVADRDQFFIQGQDGINGAPETLDLLGWATAVGDFNGDGRDDVAVGAPGEDGDRGAVHVLYGALPALSAVTNPTDQLLTQASSGIPGEPERADRFGASLASGDFNGDGRADLAIGVPGEGVGGRPHAGVVHVVHGSLNGLSTSGARQYYQGAGGVAGVAESGDRFGVSLASCDFDDDEHDDLAIGSEEGITAAATADGAVHVIFGSASGLDPGSPKDTVLRQGGSHGGVAEPSDRFGAALAAGDVNGDGRADLAVGVPGEATSAGPGVGVVQVFRGAANGFGSEQIWGQDSSGVPGTAGAWEHFGHAVAIGDLDGDGESDLAAGVPGDAYNSGAVNVIFGSGSGLVASGSVLLTQGSTGIVNGPERGDNWGSALLARALNDGAATDLVVGAGDENAGAVVDGGGLNIVYGGASLTNGPFFSQDATGIENVAEIDDLFGFSLG